MARLQSAGKFFNGNLPRGKQEIKGKRLTINSHVENNEVFIFRSVGKGGRQKVHKISASSFELAKEKAILKFSDVIHFKQKPMDLMTARKRAAKASLDAKRSYYVIYDGDGDGECSVNTAPLRGAAHKFVNGVEDKNYKPTKQEEEKPKSKTLPAQSARAKKLVDAKTAKESAEEDSTEETNITKNKMEKVAVKKKVAAKPAKKVAAKKSAAKKAVKASGDWGKKVTMTNAEMSKKIKQGYVYRNSMGVNKTKYIPERPNQELVNADYYESKPE